MSQVYFFSDLHLGHKNILRFSPGRLGDTIEEHDAIIEDIYKGIISKRDIVYFLGDVAFNNESLQRIEGWPGTKYLVRGNHDIQNEGTYRRIFKGIYGLVAYKEFWLSHCPIHPVELRGRRNIHGHVHSNSIDNPNYYNVCLEMNNSTPVHINTIREHYENINSR